MDSVLKQSKLINKFEMIREVDLDKSKILDITILVLDALDENLLNGYYMFRYFLEKYVDTNLAKEDEFKEFIFKILYKFIQITTKEMSFLLLFSLNEKSQFLITHILINPYNENNFIFQFIRLLIDEERFDIEKEILEQVNIHAKNFNKSLFGFEVFLEKIIIIHLENNKYKNMSDNEKSVINYIIKLSNSKVQKYKLKSLIKK